MRARARRRLGKYRILRTLADGGYATVYEARDTIEDIRVALKVPRRNLLHAGSLEDLRKEARTQARLDHPNILPLKNAEFIGDELVLVYPMGEGTLADRMSRRFGLGTFLSFARQMLAAVAYAHERNVMHCDIKPDNFILFAGGRLRLADFGIAKIALRTVEGSGSGTIGYLAPEQAMGRPSFRSDVFSLGLVLYQMIGRVVPVWPFDWPPPGFHRIRRRFPPEFHQFLRRALDPDPRRRYASAIDMQAAFERRVPKIRRRASGRRTRRKARPVQDWKEIRIRSFRRRFAGQIELSAACRKCEGPLHESMVACPWCGHKVARGRTPATFPDRCPRCHRGRKLDWRFCTFCHGPGFRTVSARSYSDRRYSSRCQEPRCKGPLMPFLRYCPWCRRKVKKAWKLGSSRDRCPGCGWGVSLEHWDFCPWCKRHLASRKAPPPAR